MRHTIQNRIEISICYNINVSLLCCNVQITELIIENLIDFEPKQNNYFMNFIKVLNDDLTRA